MKAIIVDDEQSARLTLRMILQEFFKDVAVVGEADSPGEAAVMIERLKPDVVFLDIQMQGGTGFDVLERLDKLDFQLVFVSAHKQHAYDSFRFDAADYLLKPVRIKDLRVALEKVRKRMNITAPGEDGKARVRQLDVEQQKKQLIVPELEGFTLVKLSELIRLESSKNYTILYLTENRQVAASKGLKEFDEVVTAHGFVRIHKSHVINLNFMSRYLKGRGGEVAMADGALLPVSRDRKEALMDSFIATVNN